jgi:hypothetical protein
MKKLLNLTLLSTAIICSMAAIPSDKAKKPNSLVGLYVANGSNYQGTISIGGSNYNFLASTLTHVADISTGYYSTVTVYCNQPGSWVYGFPGETSQTTSVGFATFTSVNITGTTTATIYHAP